MKRALGHAFLAAIAFTAGCSKQQTVQEPPDFHSSTADEPTSVPDPYKLLYRPGLSREEIAPFLAKLPYDSISLHRTPCYGTCPVYTVTLHRNGKAELEATRHLPALGKFTGEIDPITYGRLCYLIDNSRFKEMKPDYRASWTDDTTCVVTVTEGDARTRVSDYGRAGPIELWAIQELIDSTRERIKWEPAP